MVLIEYVQETVINHQVNQRAIPHALTPSGLIQSEWDAAHVFDPTRDHDLRISNRNCLGSQAYGLETGGANFVHRKSRNFPRQPGIQGDLPGRVLSQSSLKHISQNYLIDLCSIQPYATHGLFEHCNTQIDCRDRTQ
jgi:hypothetical protein